MRANRLHCSLTSRSNPEILPAAPQGKNNPAENISCSQHHAALHFCHEYSPISAIWDLSKQAHGTKYSYGYQTALLHMAV